MRFVVSGPQRCHPQQPWLNQMFVGSHEFAPNTAMVALDMGLPGAKGHRDIRPPGLLGEKLRLAWQNLCLLGSMMLQSATVAVFFSPGGQLLATNGFAACFLEHLWIILTFSTKMGEVWWGWFFPVISLTETLDLW